MVNCTLDFCIDLEHTMKKLISFIVLLLAFLGHAQQDSVIFPRESTWKYLDDGSDQGTQWKNALFLDLSWASGQAELGYGDVQTTTVSYGPSASNKYPTTYFRTNFTLGSLLTGTDELVLRLKRDDGAIVYINGTEVHRVNMPSGPVTYLDYANGVVDGANESTFFETVIDPSSVNLGNNVIAVEIHQANATSSDISFDLELVVRTPEALIPPVDCSSDLDSLHISRFTSVMPSAQPDSLRIPSTHTFQLLIQSGTPYTNSADGNMKGTFDFTGYVPRDSSSRLGYLSVNHEAGSFPAAGVSMMDIVFDTAVHIWNITNNRPVDFTSVQGTGRNCSGTVTPWNTIITAEETLPGTDANNDGYEDVGWLVEIDPATATVIDHDNDGVADKLFKMGLMSHENCVVSQDRKTVYFGNDQNPGYVFKFIANEEEHLESGDLFVMKLDGALDATTTGSWVGLPNFTPNDCNSITSYASSVGATNFDSVEDVEISPRDGKIYFTSKASSRVYRFRDLGMNVNAVEVFVGNASSEYVIETENGLVEEQWMGGVDNLTFDNEGNLYVIQDGGRNHVWMVPYCHSQEHPAVKLFCVTPAGCEPTGMTFTPDNRFMFLSIQHPSALNNYAQTDAAGAPVIFNKESCIVIARKEYLGPEAISEEPGNGGGNAGLEKLEGKIDTELYPNPTFGKVNVQINSSIAAPVIIRVTDLLGNSVRVLSKQLSIGDNHMEIDLQNLPAGIYQAILYVNGQTQVKKIVKN